MITPLALTAPDISCDHCKRTIERELGAVEGVEAVSVSVADRRVDIRYDVDRLDPAALRARLTDLGYPPA